MSTKLFMHVNNHANRKSFDRLTPKERKKLDHSYTVAGILDGDTMKFGVSICSREDVFLKETGRNRALINAERGIEYKLPAYVVEKSTIGNYFVNKAHKLIKKLHKEKPKVNENPS